MPNNRHHTRSSRPAITPVVRDNSLLLRHGALQQCCYLDKSHIQILSVTAQAGSGKTILISQYDETSDTRFAWITCTPLHADPRIFFEDIVKTLDDTCPDIQGEEILSTLQQQLNTQEIIDIAVLRLKTNMESISPCLTLVIDDAHLLHNHTTPLELIRRIHHAMPRHLRLIIISRFPLAINGEPLFAANKQLVIDESILALTHEEIAYLYNNVFGIAVGTKDIRKLHETTQGWLAGLVLLRNTVISDDLESPTSVQAIGNYFDELVRPLKDDVQRELFLAAQLTVIPESILETMCSSSFRNWLHRTASRNLFVRSHTMHGCKVFRLHHLFQAHLIQKTKSTISTEVRNSYLKKSGEKLLDSGDLETGLNYLVMAHAWEEVSDAFKTHGLSMVDEHRDKTLLDILDSVPNTIRDNDGWLTLIRGISMMNSRPMGSDECLLLAIRLFRDSGDRLGELVAHTTFSNCNVLVFGNFRRKTDLMHRTIQLFTSLKDQLTAPQIEQIAHSISLGYLYTASDTHTAKHYLELATYRGRTVRDVASNPLRLYTKILLLGLEGNTNIALKEISPFLPMSNDPMISTATRFSLDIVQANFLLLAGDLIGYREMRDYIHMKWGKRGKDVFTSVFLTVWDLDTLVAEGQYKNAYALAKDYDNAHADTTPHMRSQILHYQMIAAAHLGRKNETFRLMREALRQRMVGGGPFFLLLTHSLLGAALCLLGETRPAARVLDCVLRKYHKYNLNHGQLARAYRATIHLANGRQKEAEHDIETMLKELSEFGNYHFFGWSPDILRPLLCLAVKKSIHENFARKLARNRLALDILDNGTPIPLLRIDCIVTLKLTVGGNSIQGNDLSPLWQRLLRLLAESPSHALKVETIQEELWPESAPEKARPKFDTTLSRLRNKIGETFGEEAKQRYLQLRGQKLYLKHCTVDLDHIIKHAKSGIKLALRQDYWLAHNEFVHMRHWLKTSYDLPTSWSAGQASKDVVIRALAIWTDLLTQSNAHEEALEVANRALALDPINDIAQRQRFDLLTYLKRPGEAQKSIKRYRLTLTNEGFDDQEIDQIIETLFAA